MSKRNPEIALKQILLHAREAVAICEGKTRADLDTDRLLNLALTRLIEIIDDAAKTVRFSEMLVEASSGLSSGGDLDSGMSGGFGFKKESYNTFGGQRQR